MEFTNDQRVAGRVFAQTTGGATTVILRNALRFTPSLSSVNLEDFTGLSDALETLGSNNTDLCSTMEGFQRDRSRTANEVAELNELNGKQLTSTEQTIKALSDQFDVA
ncbi:hypothetical protein D3C76_1611400 [compost metagenome]